ncbi:hypothetical protein B0H13DRAFT_2302009 [Mycena leptocephala]|nr:hypothetical protein B0H13DRAFT_2302009 [Mycena leptocephala]
MNATDTVFRNATYHAQLLAGIAELDHVPPAEGGGHVGAQDTALERKTQKERKEHEDMRDSTTRRFAAKITGRKDKFEAKASKEEREYVEALEKEMQHKRQQVTLATMITEAKAVRVDLQRNLSATISRRKTSRSSYPEDDQLEYQLERAQGRYNEIQGSLNRELQAANLLQSANTALLQCDSKIKDALGYSRWDMWGGGRMSDMMERNALSMAEGLSLQVETFVQQAILTSTSVKPIGKINIAHGSILSDVIFDNVFSDIAFHNKIKESARNVKAVQVNLTNELNAARGRASAIGADLTTATEALTHARGALAAFRRNVFDNLAGEGSVSAPPAYRPSANEESGSSNYTPPPPPPLRPQDPHSGSSNYAQPPPQPPDLDSTYPPSRLPCRAQIWRKAPDNAAPLRRRAVPQPPTKRTAPKPQPIQDAVAPPPIVVSPFGLSQNPGQAGCPQPQPFQDAAASAEVVSSSGLSQNPGPSGLPTSPNPFRTPPPPPKAVSPSAWGSRNPFAAALATADTPADAEAKRS